MAHIHTRPGEHDMTASAYIVRDDMDEPRILLHMHKKLHVLLQPGGHIELHEHPWASIAHELHEETGYELADLEVMQPRLRVRDLPGVVVHPQPIFINTHDFPGMDHFHTDIAYLMLAHAAPRHKPADGESSDLRWLSKQEIMDVPAEEIYANTRTICDFIFNQLVDAWEPVPAKSFAL